MTETPKTAEHWESVHDGLDDLYGAGEISFAVALDRAREVGQQLERLRTAGEPSVEQARGLRKLDNVQSILASAKTSVVDAARELSLVAAALKAAAVNPQSEPSVSGIAKAIELHRPRPTGRTEYVTGNAGEIYGIEPAFVCPEGCKGSAWFFEGDECDTYKALSQSKGENNDRNI